MNLRRDILCIFGSPGAGKTVFVRALELKAKFKPISPGAELRRLAAANESDSELAREILGAGRSMPPAFANTIVRRLVAAHQSNSIAFDNFPRSADQLEQLPLVLSELGFSREKIYGLLIEATETEALRRLASRRCCVQCQVTHGGGSAFCPKCGGTLEQRADDQAAAIVAARFDTFRKETNPVVAEFAERYPLMRIGSSVSRDLQVEMCMSWIDGHRLDGGGV